MSSVERNICCSLTRKAICDLKLNGRQSYNTLHTNVINFTLFAPLHKHKKEHEFISFTFQQNYLHVRLNAVCESHSSYYKYMYLHKWSTLSYSISHDDFLSRGYTVFYITTQTVILMVHFAINHLFITMYKLSYHI